MTSLDLTLKRKGVSEERVDSEVRGWFHEMKNLIDIEGTDSEQHLKKLFDAKIVRNTCMEILKHHVSLVACNNHGRASRATLTGDVDRKS